MLNFTDFQAAAARIKAPRKTWAITHINVDKRRVLQWAD
jgi:hypothetical protein